MAQQATGLLLHQPDNLEFVQRNLGKSGRRELTLQSPDSIYMALHAGRTHTIFF